MGDTGPGRLPGALGNANRLKLGTFATNLGRGGTVSTSLRTASAALAPGPPGRQLAKSDMGLEMLVPVARWRGFGGETNYGQASFETLTWQQALAAQTRQIFVFATCHVPASSTPSWPPSRSSPSTTSQADGADSTSSAGQTRRDSMSYELVEHDSRYDMADEWAAIVRNLWTSKEEFDFDGTYFQLRGACCEPKPLADPYPPIMNAGGSARGQRFAAENADIVFLFVRDPGNLEEMQKSVTGYYRETSPGRRETASASGPAPPSSAALPRPRRATTPNTSCTRKATRSRWPTCSPPLASSQPCSATRPSRSPTAYWPAGAVSSWSVPRRRSRRGWA